MLSESLGVDPREYGFDDDDDDDLDSDRDEDDDDEDQDDILCVLSAFFVS